MLVMRLRATWLFGGVLLASACTAEAQEFSANGFLDGGLVIPSHDKSWLKGGFGKLDNGGGGGQSPALVSQGVADLRLTLDPSAFVFATVRASPDQHAPFDVLEAYGRYQPIATADRLWSIKLGAFFPPISLENESVGWTSPWTLTPSAINSWVGDELRTIGGESTFEWRYPDGALGLTGAAFGFNDPTGTLLANRGSAHRQRFWLAHEIHEPGSRNLSRRHRHFEPGDVRQYRYPALRRFPQHHRLPIGLPPGRVLFRRVPCRRPGRCVCDRAAHIFRAARIGRARPRLHLVRQLDPNPLVPPRDRADPGRQLARLARHRGAQPECERAAGPACRADLLLGLDKPDATQQRGFLGNCRVRSCRTAGQAASRRQPCPKPWCSTRRTTRSASSR